MYKIIFLIVFNVLSPQGRDTISPDGKFTLIIEVKEESDLQKRYIAKLTDNELKETFEIVNCVRRDLSAPNFYWDKNSKYLVFEQCTESFKDSRIKILNLKTRKTEFELLGLIGNKDGSHQQFDANNDILIYFDTSINENGKIPNLYALDLKTKKKKRIHEFRVKMDIEFPEIRRIDGKRQIKISYNDTVAGQNITKLIDY
ncbi:MAG: hypothetical protein O9262_03860 [Cyclobacteriaceae bacterium]|nr:hypothetical protein [Cyclobacteriaceae bacterium]